MKTDIQEQIISCLLTEPNIADKAMNIVNTSMFDLKYKEVITYIDNKVKSGDSYDLVTISNNVNLIQIGGITQLTKIMMLSAPVYKIEEYCYILKEQHTRKNIEQHLISSLELISNEKDLNKVIYYIQSFSDNMITELVRNDGLVHISKIVEESISEAEKRIKERLRGEALGVRSGLRALDQMIHYMKGGQLIVVGGRAAMGKSMFMMHLAKQAAFDGFPVCMYSLEMTSVSLADRLIFSMSNIDYVGYKIGQFNDWQELSSVQDKINKLPIYIDSNPKVSMGYIANHSRRMKKEGKCGVIFIDYLQLAQMDEKGRTREQEVSKASREAKLLAKELNVPVILLSQISRAAENESQKKPSLSHLRESGDIENNADIVMLLYRPAYYGIVDYKLNNGELISSSGVMDVIVAKNRDGQVGEAIVRHSENLTQITNY